MTDLVITGPGPEQLVIVEETTAFLGFSATGLPGLAGKDAAGLIPVPFSRLGPQSVSVGAQRFYVDFDVAHLGGRASLGTPAQGSDFIVRFNLDGVPWFQTTITDGFGSSGFVDGLNAPIPAGSYITVDVVQVGSSVPGSDLTVTLWMRATP